MREPSSLGAPAHACWENRISSKLGHSDRCCAPASAAWQARRQQQQHALSPTLLLFTSFLSHGCTVLSCSRTRHRLPGSPAVTRCAQRAFCAAQRPQTNQTDPLRDDKKKEDTILILHKMQNKNHDIQIFTFISRFNRSGCFYSKFYARSFLNYA